MMEEYMYIGIQCKKSSSHGRENETKQNGEKYFATPVNVNRSAWFHGKLFNWRPAIHVTDPTLVAVCGALVKFNTDMNECEGLHQSLHIRLSQNYHVSYVSLMHKNTTIWTTTLPLSYASFPHSQGRPLFSRA